MAPVASAAGANQGSSNDELSAEELQLLVQNMLLTAPSGFSDQPIPHAFYPYPDGFWLGKDGNYIQRYVSVISVDGSTVALFGYMNGNYTDIVAVSNVQDTQMGESTTNQTVRGWICDQLDSVSGYYYGVYHYFSKAFQEVNFPIFSDLSTGLAAASVFLAANSGPSATLVANGDSFSFDTDYSVNNTTGVDIAVASYNLGGNDIIVIGCYETVVVPGTIEGLSANYNVNQILPREEHIPIRYCSLISDTTFSSLTPFTSLEDAVSACYDVLQDSPNHGGGYTPSDVQFTLQPGNVAYIQMADLSEKVILSSAKSSYSALFQTAGSYWPGNQLYKSGMDYPTVGTILPGATPNQIPWQKNEWGKENLLGQTKQAYAEITASSNLLMIYNPYYQGDDSSTLTNSNLINSAIVITSKGIARNGIRVYNLQDSFSTVDGNYYYGIGSTNPNGYGDYFQSENDPNATNPDVTGWTDENGDPTTAPGVTPYNDPPENDSIADVITKFISNITGLFTQGHEAIKTLSENGAEFVSHLSELYSWLPPQVLAVLTSAIILAIIIGVLKVFL